MRLPEEPDVPIQINVTPLIDVVFAILTFFVISSLYLSRTQGLPVNLPKAISGQADSPSQVTVTIYANGNIFLNQDAISLDQLEAGVRQKIQPQQQFIVVVNADEGVNHGKVVAVMDRVRRIEGARLAIATQH